MSRQFGVINGGRSLPWGFGKRPAVSRDTQREIDSSDYELGGYVLFAGLFLCPWIIVLGLMFTYLLFV